MRRNKRLRKDMQSPDHAKERFSWRNFDGRTERELAVRIYRNCGRMLQLLVLENVQLLEIQFQ